MRQIKKKKNHCCAFFVLFEIQLNTSQFIFSNSVPVQKVYMLILLTKRGLVFVLCLNIFFFAQMFCIAKSFIK